MAPHQWRFLGLPAIDHADIIDSTFSISHCDLKQWGPLLRTDPGPCNQISFIGATVLKRPHACLVMTDQLRDIRGFGCVGVGLCFWWCALIVCFDCMFWLQLSLIRRCVEALMDHLWGDTYEVTSHLWIPRKEGYHSLFLGGVFKGWIDATARVISDAQKSLYFLAGDHFPVPRKYVQWSLNAMFSLRGWILLTETTGRLVLMCSWTTIEIKLQAVSKGIHSQRALPRHVQSLTSTGASVPRLLPLKPTCPFSAGFKTFKIKSWLQQNDKRLHPGMHRVGSVISFTDFK